MAYLTLIAVARGAVAGCGAHSACDKAMGSAWAWWAGVPVSGLAAGVYALLLTAMVTAMRSGPRVQKIAWIILVTLAVILIGAAMWFGYVLHFRIGVMCVWCTISHVIGIITAALIIWISVIMPRSGDGEQSIGWRQWGGGGLAGLLALSGLIGVQVWKPMLQYAISNASASEPSERGRQNEARHMVGAPGMKPPELGAYYVINGDRRAIAPVFTNIQMDPYVVPMLGSADAKHILVLILDYTCDYCHTIHKLLELAHRRYGDQFAVVLVANPINGNCNPLFSELSVAPRKGACEYAKLSLAIWRASPQKFSEFEQWLVSLHFPAPLDVAIQKAMELVGQSALESALDDPWVEEQLQRNTEFSRAPAAHFRTSPILILPDSYMTGRPDSAEQLFSILESRLGIKPLAHVSVKQAAAAIP